MLILMGHQKTAIRAIRRAIAESVQGHGQYVYACGFRQDWTRIYNVRMNHGLVQAQSLNIGEWFTIASWELR